MTSQKHHICRINQCDLVIVHRTTFDKKHLVKKCFRGKIYNLNNLHPDYLVYLNYSFFPPTSVPMEVDVLVSDTTRSSQCSGTKSRIFLPVVKTVKK